MRQMFNVKQGIELTKVRLPKRMLGYPPLEEDANKGITVSHSEELRLE